MPNDRPVVLIVDDMPLTLKLLAELLAPDYQVKVATNGPEALRLAHQQPQPELILLDAMMPEMDGYAVCAALRAAPITAAIPVVFITARTDTESETRALAVGAVDFIHKPINPAVVVARVRLQLELAAHRSRLSELVQARTRELAQARDAAEGANRAKDAFLATMSHEMRTPLNHIMGMAYLLRPEVPAARGQAFLTTIDQSARRLLDMVGDILDLSRLEADEIVIAHEEFQPPELLARVLQEAGELAREKGLSLCETIDPALPSQLKGDPDHLRRVLGHLLANAVKFSREGCIRLQVRVLPGEFGGLVLRCEVEDQGIGIAPEVLPRLFEPFTQGDQSLSRAHGGAGIGLALCRRLVTLMGGALNLASTPGQGTTVTIEVPMVTAGESRQP